MAVEVKDTESKVTVAKRNITIKDVSIKDGVLADEEGNIVSRLIDATKDFVDTFTIKISFEIPEE